MSVRIPSESALTDGDYSVSATTVNTTTGSTSNASAVTEFRVLHPIPDTPMIDDVSIVDDENGAHVTDSEGNLTLRVRLGNPGSCVATEVGGTATYSSETTYQGDPALLSRTATGLESVGGYVEVPWSPKDSDGNTMPDGGEIAVSLSCTVQFTVLSVPHTLSSDKSTFATIPYWAS
jgi:hypothetical protein